MHPQSLLTERRTRTRWVLLLLCGLVVGCTSAQHVGERGLPEAEGTASYYADKFVGRATANGEIFTQEALTAAHRSLPFGTRIRVTRTDHFDRPSVVVRINDRGPFKGGRIVDLTKKAARRLQMIRDGLAEVRLEVLSYPARLEVADSDSSTIDSSRVRTPNVAW
mgnify:CR=1 FL=1